MATPKFKDIGELNRRISVQKLQYTTDESGATQASGTIEVLQAWASVQQLSSKQMLYLGHTELIGALEIYIRHSKLREDLVKKDNTIIYEGVEYRIESLDIVVERDKRFFYLIVKGNG